VDEFAMGGLWVIDEVEAGGFFLFLNSYRNLFLQKLLSHLHHKHIHLWNIHSGSKEGKYPNSH
jgi:hypothetical protein